MTIPLNKNRAAKMGNKEDCKISLLDLPEPTLYCILERLSPVDLCSVAQVCTSFRDRCRSDGLWEKHIKQKWGTLLGDVACREWEWHVARIMMANPFIQLNTNGLLGSFNGAWPYICLGSYLENPRNLTSLLQANCPKMALYISLQSGQFWFPAQVYRSLKLCDALVSYDNIRNTFRARCPTGGWHVIEENIQWDRLRLSPVHTPPNTLCVSNCLNDLKPGDHIEIQKKRRRDLPYDWYYAVIGHLETCDGDENHCQCQYSDTLIVLFTQYRSGSPWKRTVLNRKVYAEKSIGFWSYGGIRKLDKQEEIERWNRSIRRSYVV